MNIQEFKVGDIWKWVNREKEFEVLEVDSDGDAWTEYYSCVGCDRILKGEVVLIYRDIATFTKADLVAGKHVVEVECGNYYLALADDVCIQLDGLDYPYKTKVLGWDKAETLFSDLGVAKVYEIAQMKGGGFSFGDLKVVWSGDKAELKAKLSELEQKKLEIEAEIDKLKEGL
jgi:hypothetical protein